MSGRRGAGLWRRGRSSYGFELELRDVAVPYTTGTTVGDYLTRCRVAEARRLLITTSMGANGIAHTSGFGPQSSFYAHFSRMCGVSPAEYRSLHR